MTKCLEGKHAIVTGAGGGIGSASALLLAEKGARLTLLGRTESSLLETAQKITQQGGEAQIFGMDVTNESGVEKSFKDAVKKFGDIFVLVNNAGAADSAPLIKMKRELWERMLSVNLTGVFLCAKYAVPTMQKKGGRIVNISSTAGVAGYRYVSAYCAAKHGVIGFTRALARELSEARITVNAVCPGFTDTDLFRGSVARVASKTGRPMAEVQSEFLKNVPAERLITPGEIASTVAWLCEPAQAAITGQSIVIAGGEVL